MNTEMIIVLCATYLVIGRLVHEITEPHLRDKALRAYTQNNWTTYIMDIVFWLPLGIIAVIYNIKNRI